MSFWQTVEPRVEGIAIGLATSGVALIVAAAYRRVRVRVDPVERRTALRTAAAASMKDANAFLIAIAYLKWRYMSHSRCLVRIGPSDYPCWVVPSPDAQRKRPDDCLISLTESFSDDYIVNDPYMHVLPSAQPGTLENLPVYALQRMEVCRDSIRLHCRMGRFFDGLDTSVVLSHELLAQVGKVKRQPRNSRGWSRFERHRLPLRHALHQGIDDPLLDGAGRCAVLGVSVVTMFNSGEGEYRVLVHRRSGSGVVVQPGLIGVVPTFTFQPIVGDLRGEFSVVDNVLREYLEELFSVQEDGATDSARYFYDDPNIVYLRELLAKGEASLTFTGISTNLLDLTADVCVLLRIDCPDWYAFHSGGRPSGDRRLSRLRYNSEFEPSASGLMRFSLADLLDEESLACRVPAADVAPPAAGALRLAIDLLRSGAECDVVK